MKVFFRKRISIEDMSPMDPALEVSFLKFQQIPVLEPASPALRSAAFPFLSVQFILQNLWSQIIRVSKTKTANS